MAIMVSNSLTNRRRTARKPPVCHSGPAVDSILFPSAAAQLKRTPLDKKLPGITAPIVPRSGRCPPPPTPTEITCTLEKDEPIPIYVDDDFTFLWMGCNTAYNNELPLSPTVDATIGEINTVEDGQNCIAGQNIAYTAPSEPGEEILTLTVTWPDSSTCISILTFDILAEENGD